MGLLQNSLLVSGLTALGSALLGMSAALFLAGLERRWRRPLLVAAVMALVMPPFLVTNCWLDLLGATGRWRGWLPVNLYSLGGTVWILTLLTWPISLLLVLSAWSRLEPAQLEMDPALTGWPLIRWLLWPMARGAVGQAGGVTFVLALNHFAVPAILQVKVLPAEVWVMFNTHLNPAEALAVGWPLIVAPVLLLGIFRRSEIRWPRLEGAATARTFRRQLGWFWWGSSAAVVVVILGLAVALPLGQIVGSGQTWSEVPNLLRAAPGIVMNSAGYAAVTASVCVAVGVLSWRWRIGLSVWISFLVPGVLLGIGLIVVFNRPGLDWFYRSAGIVVLALTLRYLALGWHGVAHALRSVDRDLTDAARLEGAAGWTLFRHVQWPQIAPQAGAAWAVTYLLCLWDVETILLICPPGGQTLAQNVFNLLHYGHTAQVNAYCVVLLGLALAPWLVWGVGRRLARQRRNP